MDKLRTSIQNSEFYIEFYYFSFIHFLHDNYENNYAITVLNCNFNFEEREICAYDEEL